VGRHHWTEGDCHHWMEGDHPHSFPVVTSRKGAMYVVDNDSTES